MIRAIPARIVDVFSGIIQILVGGGASRWAKNQETEQGEFQGFQQEVHNFGQKAQIKAVLNENQ